MPNSPARPCSMCGQPVWKKGKCKKHLDQADRMRGTSTERGYNTPGHVYGFRANVLYRAFHKCVLCGARGTVADHFPRTRKELLRDGEDPDNPDFGRCLCVSCHNSHTAQTAGKHNLPNR